MSLNPCLSLQDGEVNGDVDSEEEEDDEDEEEDGNGFTSSMIICFHAEILIADTL